MSPAKTTHCRKRPGPAGALGVRGFTLIELVMVIVLVGVLAVYAVPRMISSSDLNARGFHDSTLAYLRYAQKTAIAQRRTVCVVFNSTVDTSCVATATAATTATLCMASAAGATGCDQQLIGPRGEKPGTITAEPGVTYSTPPLTLHFDGLGQPLSDAGVPLTTARTIQVSNVVNTATVEAVTGYVHE